MRYSRNPWKQGLLHALGVSLYTSLVTWLMYNIGQRLPEQNNFLGPTTFLLLFVLSAGVVGSLVVGLPAMLYLDNHKKEGVKLLVSTILWIFIIFVALVLTQLALL